MFTSHDHQVVVKKPSRNPIGSTGQLQTLRRSPRFFHQKFSPEPKQPTNLRKSPRLHQKSIASEAEDPKTPKSKSKSSNNRARSLGSAQENKDYSEKDSQRMSKFDRGTRNSANLSSGSRGSQRLNSGVEGFRSLSRSPRFSNKQNVVDERIYHLEKALEKTRKSDIGLSCCGSSGLRNSPTLDSSIGGAEGLRRSQRVSNQQNIVHEYVEKSGGFLDEEETYDGKAGKNVIYCEQIAGKREGQTRVTKGNSIGPEVVIVEGEERKADIVIKRKRKRDEEYIGITKDWANEQELALQRAYFAAKPTPHFWKKVSKLVPGKSAQECFDKVHSNNLTPLQPLPRSRTKKAKSSPLQNVLHSASRLLKPRVKRLSCNKQKTHLSQKTVRHLLQKHYHADRDYEADLFSVLEPNMDPSTQAFQPDLILSTPKQLQEKQGFLQKFHEISSSGHKKPLPGFGSSSLMTLVSPPVLKQVKNRVLHEKYIDRLHYREAKRKAASARAEKFSIVEEDTKDTHVQNIDVVRAAKNALVSDARYVITHYQHSQAIAMRSSDFNDDDGVDSNEDEGEGEDGT